MKIFVAHSSNFDFKNKLYLPLRSSELNKRYDIFLPQEFKKELITKEMIKGTDVIIAEISYPSTGQGIELGWADVFKIPIICIYKQGSSYSPTVEKLTDKIISYESSGDMIIKLNEILENFKSKIAI